MEDTPVVQSTSAWDAIYNHVYPDLHNEYQQHHQDYVSAMFQQHPDVLTVEENTAIQTEEMEYFRSEMAKVIQVRALLRRLAGYRH